MGATGALLRGFGMGAALSAYARPALLALASAAAASLLALGLYATTPRARQGIGGIVASTLWWSLADRLGVEGSFPYRSDQLTAATLDACLRKGGTLTDPGTRVVGFERASFGEGGAGSSAKWSGWSCGSRAPPPRRRRASWSPSSARGTSRRGYSRGSCRRSRP
eukprot:COSAG04_NODE_10928_length_743_cov_0.881988_1_plen_164_part_10